MSGAGAQRPVELTFTYGEDGYLSARAFFWRRRDPKFERALMGVFLGARMRAAARAARLALS